MKPFVASRSPCPIGRASRLLGDRWVLLILRELFLGRTHFEEFMAALPISRAALTSRLGWLGEAGVIARDPPDGRRSAYRLTAAGEALAPVLGAVREWGDQWLPPATAQQKGAPAHRPERPSGGSQGVRERRAD